MTADTKLAALSFTGGKDCCLAYHRAVEQGFKVAVVVTFGPRDQRFRAHPLPLIQQQAKAMGLPHVVCTIDGPDYLQNYRVAIEKLKEEHGIHALITGDILPVCSNFMERACEGIVSLERPLWGAPRPELLEEIFASFDVMVTCLNKRKLPSVPDLKPAVGQRLSMSWLEQYCDKDKADLAGEYGEFHTMVLDAPLFTQGKVDITDAIPEEEGNFVFYKVNACQLVPK
ncbi:hypothetical protein BC940DRAFT_368402 [Gongronella butleri]|nr:hypothetical protein BC940DRAFT_368402 [Gongronella butleri]